jgi:hypothetical protein
MVTLLSLSAVCWAIAGAAPAALDEPASGDTVDSTRRSEWEIVFEDGITIKQYAERLDYFKIEIGAVAKDGRVEYASNISARKPDKRLGDATKDYRWRTAWKKGKLSAADRALLTKAGINSRDKQLLHYFPDEIQARLAQLERAYGKRDPREIKRTRFEIRPQAKEPGFEFVVVEQDPPPRSSEPPANKKSIANP